MMSFTVIFQDGVVAVRIDDEGHVDLVIDSLKDDGVLVQAINVAVRAGAKTGSMFTGEVVNDQEAAKWLDRVAHGRTWLGGIVVRLADGELGPQFRVDWSEMPRITERNRP